MKELSLNLLDIAKNSVHGGASNILIELDELTEPGALRIKIEDDGRGIPPDLLRVIEDPFATTRTTRPVGMGIPFFKMAAEMTGGSFSIKSVVSEGTQVTAVFYKDHIDMPPLGGVWDTLAALIGGSPDIDFIYRHNTESGSFSLDTIELRATLGDVPLNEPEIILWITEYIKENEKLL